MVDSHGAVKCITKKAPLHPHLQVAVLMKTLEEAKHENAGLADLRRRAEQGSRVAADLMGQLREAQAALDTAQVRFLSILLCTHAVSSCLPLYIQVSSQHRLCYLGRSLHISYLPPLAPLCRASSLGCACGCLSLRMSLALGRQAGAGLAAPVQGMQSSKS